MRNRIFIIGGHFTPAKAIYEKLKDNKSLDIYFVGIKHTMLFDKSLSSEYKFAKENNIKFISVNTGKLYRFFSLKGILSLILIPIGFIQSFIYLIKYKPKLLIGFGSYIDVPIILTGNLLNIKSIIHTQASIPGLATRLTAKKAQKICVSFEDSRQYFDRKKTLFTGNILRKEIFTNNSNDFYFKYNLPIIYITGGNQGSHFINQLIFDCLDTLLESYNIIHQTGSNTIYNDYRKSIELKDKLSNLKKQRYISKEGIWNNQIGEVFSKASLIISRAGANSVSEILYLSKRAILIPIKNSSYNEQENNAYIAKKLGRVTVLDQDKVTKEHLIEEIRVILNLPEKKYTLETLDASSLMYNEIMKLLN